MWAWPLIFIAALVGLSVLSLFILLAKTIVKIHREHTAAIKPTYVETRSEDLSEEMREIIGQWVQQFSAEGFEVLANLRNADGVTGAEGIQLFFVQHSTKDNAQALMVRAGFKRVFTVVISSDFEDGHRITTTSRRTVSHMPRNPNVDGIAFPWVKDAATLCEAHRRRVASHGRTAFARRYPTANTLSSWLVERWDKDLRRSVSLGYRFADPTAGVYRFTWKGAFLSTLKLLPPVRRIRMRRLEIESRKVWNSLKMNDFVAVPTSPLSSSEPAQVVSRDGTQNSGLRYASDLSPGEVRTEVSESSVTIRIGRDSTNRAAIRAWINIALSAFIVSGLGIDFWISMKLSSISPAFASK